MRSEEHKKVEAVLFAVGRDIAIEDVAGLCTLGQERVMEILHELQQEYAANATSALALHEKGKFWKFSVKDQYLPLVTNLVQNTELDKSTMETLAVIAWKYPILQADLVKIRHTKAYDHLKALEEREFISKEKSGRTFKIRLTPKFFEYFDLPSQDAKEAFKKVIPPEMQQEIQNAEAEIERKEKEIEEREKAKAAQQQATLQSPAQPAPAQKSEDELAKEAAAKVE